MISRRSFITGLAGLPVISHGLPLSRTPKTVHLVIDHHGVNLTGKSATATLINGALPAPTLRWREGDEVSIRVTNRLPVMSAIHWHGIILPSEMDGVPGLSFPGIPPGQTFHYRFKLNQAGTYWYHSHSGFQEQTGVYGAIVIDPAGDDPVFADREHTIVLSDWSDEDPHKIFATLKKRSHIYNRNRRTVRDLGRDLRRDGIAKTFQARRMWNEMRMDDTDLVDVTGYTYTYLMNGQPPSEGWHGLCQAGEVVRLRIINAAAMSIFDLRIPGLKMQVVNTDGQNVEPISVDELRLAPAETIDVLVRPESDMAYTFFAQVIDRSGYAVGYLSPDVGLRSDIPEMDPVPRLSHSDMGMAHGEHHRHGHHGSNQSKIELGPGVDMVAEQPEYRLDDPGVGLRNNGRRVLTYADLRRLGPSMSMQEPDEDIEIHLTGNMMRYIWSMDGISRAEAGPIVWRYGERKRITLINDTMMNHPIHLHGMWSELETGDLKRLPAKHTVVAQPGSKISFRVSADAHGRWAFHCHMLYHMMGMFREVQVV